MSEPAAHVGDHSAPDGTWWWRLHDAAGGEVHPGGEHASYDGQRFASQGDAESWVGEFWPDLAEAGVASVTLVEVDRDVYGPMSLST